MFQTCPFNHGFFTGLISVTSYGGENRSVMGGKMELD